MVEREEIQFAFSQEHWLKASARMLLRAGGLCRIGHFVSTRTHRMDDGARHDDLGTSWMVVGHVRLGLDGAGYGRCDSSLQIGLLLGPQGVGAAREARLGSSPSLPGPSYEPPRIELRPRLAAVAGSIVAVRLTQVRR